MPKVALKKYVLVSFDNDEESVQDFRKLRRYLANHKLEFTSSSNPDEIKEHLNKLVKKRTIFHQTSDVQTDNDVPLAIDEPSTPTFSNQELLELWANGAFSEGSEAIDLLLGTSSAQQIDDQELENITFDIPQLFTVHSIDSEPINDPENGKEDNQTFSFCRLCETHINVARNRTTKIKQLAKHVIECHSNEKFLGVSIEKRYQCLRCKRTLPVSKSPCDHIYDYHGKVNNEFEFLDLWTKTQVFGFNSVLEQCFEKHLPVPRSRRTRPGDTWSGDILEQKASYRIVQGDDVVQIDAVIEKPRSSQIDKSLKAENGQAAGSSNAADQEITSASDDDELFIHDEIDSKDFDIDMKESDHNYFKDDCTR